ncbi:MAG: hypothetical protein Q9221_007238 [Calogaya cf. arnoldii]
MRPPPLPSPSPRPQLSAIQFPRVPVPVIKTKDLSKRNGFRRHTLANGWVIHYRVISVIYPVLSSLMDLRTLYTGILTEVARRSSDGHLTAQAETFTCGKVVLQFRAERGYSYSVGWDIVAAFTETLLQGQLPMTFVCHIAPPGSDVGIQVELRVLL